MFCHLHEIVTKFKNKRLLHMLMTAYQMAFLGLNKLTQQGMAKTINEGAKGMHIPLQGEPYRIKYDGRMDTPSKLEGVHFTRMGVNGPNAYALGIVQATKNPDGFATYLPDDNISRLLQQTLPIPDFAREQLGLQHAPKTNPNTGKQEKKYHKNAYSYAKYARAGYIKSAAKAIYGKVENEARNAMAKIRAVYQTGKGFFRGVKEYQGQDSKSNVISLDAYRAAREHRKYAVQSASGSTLEERVA